MILRCRFFLSEQHREILVNKIAAAKLPGDLREEFFCGGDYQTAWTNFERRIDATLVRLY